MKTLHTCHGCDNCTHTTHCSYPDALHRDTFSSHVLAFIALAAFLSVPAAILTATGITLWHTL